MQILSQRSRVGVFTQRRPRVGRKGGSGNRDWNVKNKSIKKVWKKKKGPGWVAVWKVCVFCIRPYQKTSEFGKSSARGPGQKIVPWGTLPLWAGSQPPVQELRLPVVSRLVAQQCLLVSCFPCSSSENTLGWTLRGTQISRTEVIISSGRGKGEPGACPLFTLVLGLEDLWADELLHWEFLWEQCVLLVGLSSLICLSFIITSLN